LSARFRLAHPVRSIAPSTSSTRSLFCLRLGRVGLCGSGRRRSSALLCALFLVLEKRLTVHKIVFRTPRHKPIYRPESLGNLLRLSGKLGAFQHWIRALKIDANHKPTEVSLERSRPVRSLLSGDLVCRHGVSITDANSKRVRQLGEQSNKRLHMFQLGKFADGIAQIQMGVLVQPECHLESAQIHPSGQYNLPVLNGRILQLVGNGPFSVEQRLDPPPLICRANHQSPLRVHTLLIENCRVVLSCL
jgi:hypothetical protein